MKLLIGEKLKLYRRNRDLTQEDVAAALGVTYQAISKWERNEGYPDITMLPSLANYFGITVDELIGMEEIASKSRYDEINALWLSTHEKAKAEGDDSLHLKNISLMRNALKTYPGDQLLLVQLSTSIERLSGTEEEKRENLRESLRIQEEILRGPDSEVRNATLYNICFAYLQLGEHEKAIAAAKKLPNLYKARENAIVALSSGEEKAQTAREAISALDWVLKHHLSALAEVENNSTYLEKYCRISEILNS
ncbi:MAG: helix-turn-helix transcriptional regulator [Clostridia bacterium]|nr:helix-turn-helix transcriptional regulator [Clostridia bacterium]